MKALKLQNLVNHITFIIDKSASMNGLYRQVEKVFDNEISQLRIRSKELDQETRVSVYLFNAQVECLVFDMDVMRMPSLVGTIGVSGRTALLDATAQAIRDLETLPEKYGDHAFLFYVITDGEENDSGIDKDDFRRLLSNLKDNCTVTCMVPDQRGVYEAKKFGFPKNNIAIWSTTDEGIREVGKVTRSAMNSYMDMRAKGVRSTSNFYHTDLGNVTKTQVKRTLDELKPSQYRILRVGNKDEVIKPFIERWLKQEYRIGQGYYELVKTEEIQGGKAVCIQHKQDGRVYGGQEAREVLQLPSYTLKVKPGDHGDWNIFVQSTSVNRKLPAHTSLLVMI